VPHCQLGGHHSDLFVHHVYQHCTARAVARSLLHTASKERCPRMATAEETTKRDAWAIVAAARDKGKIVPAPCKRCGATINIHGHHENYARPLDLTWLCSVCHGTRHGVLRAAALRSIQPVPILVWCGASRSAGRVPLSEADRICAAEEMLLALRLVGISVDHEKGDGYAASLMATLLPL
jgi:hypothetical protein